MGFGLKWVLTTIIQALPNMTKIIFFYFHVIDGFDCELYRQINSDLQETETEEEN